MSAPAYDFVRLAPKQVEADHHFTDTDWNTADLQALVFMASQLTGLFDQADIAGRDGVYSYVQSVEPGSDRQLRILVNNLDGLRNSGDKPVVGFFGSRRADADRKPIDGVDVALLAEFPAYPSILAYCTLQLPDGNYGNLVVLGDEPAREHWRESRHHQYAVAELAPKYYRSVRLHNGVWSGAEATPHISLTRTKYYDYEAGLWCAVRDYGEAPAA